MSIEISKADIEKATSTGSEAVATLLAERIKAAAGGELTAENMAQLNGEQLTLWGYFILRDELMDGGFIQLIHNGYAPFFFFNPFAKVMRLWGLPELAKLINKGRKLFQKYGTELTRDCSDEEFMALFERFPAFDCLDDEFVEDEEAFTQAVGEYVSAHLPLFLNTETDNGRQ